MLSFETIDSTNLIDFNDGSDFIIGYARSLEAFDQYLDKALLDVSCENAENTNDSSVIGRLKRIVDSVINFLSTLINKLKEFVLKYFRKGNRDTSEGTDPNRYNGKNSMKYQEKKPYKVLGDLVFSWWYDVEHLLQEDRITDVTVYSKLEQKYKDDYNTWKKTGNVSTTRKMPYSTSVFNDKTIPISGCLGILGEELNKLKDIKNFLLKLQSGVTSKAGGQRAVKKLNTLNKGDIEQTVTNTKDHPVKDNVVSHPIKLAIDLLNNSKKNGKLSIATIKDVLAKTITFVRTQVHCLFSLLKHSVELMSLIKHEHSDKTQIFKVYTFPQDVKLEIAKVIRYKEGVAGKLPVIHLVITSLDHFAKPGFIINNRSAAGATANKGFQHDIGKGINARGSNVVVNYYLFNLDFISDHILQIASVIAHECGHIYNAASQVVKNGKREYANRHAESGKEYSEHYDTDPDEAYANKQGNKILSGSSIPKLKSWLMKISEDLNNITRSQKGHTGAEHAGA